MHRPHLSSVLVTGALLTAACSSPPSDSASPAGGQPETTSITTPATESTAEVMVTALPLEPAGAIKTWEAMWDGVELVVTDPGEARERIGDVATDQVLDQLDRIYNPKVESEVANSARLFDNNPVLVELLDGTVTINDCMFVAPKFGNATIWYSGRLTEVGGEWQVQAVNLESEIGCVPSQLAEAAIAGYENYWDARVQFWDPPDPASPLVDATLTGPQLELVNSLLTDHQRRGLALRGRAENHPEVIEVRSPDEIAILDCKFQDPGRGLFDIDSGARLAGIPAIAEGQRDLTSAVMILEGGVWKVSDVQGKADVSCDIAPTTQGLPLV